MRFLGGNTKICKKWLIVVVFLLTAGVKKKKKKRGVGWVEGEPPTGNASLSYHH